MSDSKDSENLDQQQNQDRTEAEQPDDAVKLLASELKEIRQALGLGEGASSSSLMQRLNSIEEKISRPERERNLPKQITQSQLGSRKFLLDNKIDLTDISSGRVQVVKD